MPRFVFVSVLSLSLVFVACAKEPAPDPISFEAEIDDSQDVQEISKSHLGTTRGVVPPKEASASSHPVQESKPTASKPEVTNVEDPSVKIAVPEINKLQEGSHTESVRSLQYLMCKIYHLEKEVQYRLVKDRLMNAVVSFTESTKLISRYNIYDYVETSKTKWELSNILYFPKECKEERDPEIGVRVYLFTQVSVYVKPNEEMVAWMKARDEYQEYSGETIPDDRLKFDLSGSVLSYEFGELLKDNKRIGEDGLRVSINLGSFTTGRMIFETDRKQRRGTILQHTETLRRKTRLWVNYYRREGVGNKPQLFFKTEEEKEENSDDYE